MARTSSTSWIWWILLEIKSYRRTIVSRGRCKLCPHGFLCLVGQMKERIVHMQIFFVLQIPKNNAKSITNYCQSFIFQRERGEGWSVWQTHLECWNLLVHCQLPQRKLTKRISTIVAYHINLLESMI